MSKNLRRRFAFQKVRITDLTPTGTKSAEVEYETLDDAGAVLNSGIAACFDIDDIELDDDDCLTGDARLSATGEFIVKTRTFDRSGLGFTKSK